MGAVSNASAEIAAANNYPHIRLFTVGAATANAPGAPPLVDLRTVQQPWAVASNRTVAANGEFGDFSAVCFLFGKELSDRLQLATPGVPLGLISNNVGGTRIERSFFFAPSYWQTWVKLLV